MATRSYVAQRVSPSNARYDCTWTIEGWSAYLKKVERRPLEQRLQTGQHSWKLKLDCSVDSDRKPSWSLLAELQERAPAAIISALGWCSLLGLKSKEAANVLSKHGKSRSILMALPEEDVLATQKLDKIDICIRFVITELLLGTERGDLLTIEEMTSLPEEVYDFATTDTAIMVGGRMIRVHEAVLADSSPIFESLLKVETCKRLDLPDLDFQTAKELVKFAYTKREPNFQEMDACAVSDLLKAAETHGLEKLKKHAADHLASRLDPANAIDILLRAEEIGNLSMKKKVLLFIKNNKQLFSKDKFGRLKNRPDLLTEILDVICS